MARNKQLIMVLDKHFDLFSPIREEILQAVKQDEHEQKTLDEDTIATILIGFNDIFKKKCRVLTKAVVSKYKAALRHYSLDEIFKAMENAKQNEFHKSNKYTYCTPEYFSRIEQIDKWLNVVDKAEEQKEEFLLPKFNIKG
jgi:hypothetical protein